jgi:transcriptional regulator with XRE-family HTH domain
MIVVFARVNAVSMSSELGPLIRAQRLQQRLSVRALAAAADISPAYVTAIETGRSSSTGRPPSPSAVVLGKLAGALGVTVGELHRAATDTAPDEHGHVLVYVVDSEPTDPFEILDATFGDRVDHWIYVPDPRAVPVQASARVSVCSWPLGSRPYDSNDLQPDHVVHALTGAVRSRAKHLRGKRVGFAVADCSAVMRYVQNPATHLRMELRWHEQVTRIWDTYLHSAPAIDVCVYRDGDLDALALTIDRLSTTLDLISRHDDVLVLNQGQQLSNGSVAVAALLERARPRGVGKSAWAALSSAASRGLTTME